MKRKYVLHIVICFFIFMFVLLCMGTLSTKANTTLLSQLSGKTIGSAMGTYVNNAVKEYYNDNIEIEDFNSFPDSVDALRNEKVDAILTDEATGTELARTSSDIKRLNETISSIDYAAMFPKSEKGAALCAEFNSFLEACKTDGTIEELEEKWLNTDDVNIRVVQDITELEATNGTLEISTDPYSSPLNYVSGTDIVGYEIDLVIRFCVKQGYGINLHEVDSSALINDVITEKSDMIIGSILVTEERAQLAYFSDPTYTSGITVLVLDEENPFAILDPINYFIKKILDGFTSTFIEGGRWSLFLEGLSNTLIISFLSMAFGIIVGIILYMLSRVFGKMFQKILKVLIWLIQGVPEVVLLLVAYYVIFGQSLISGVWTSVIVFTALFTLTTYGILEHGFSLVSAAQIEAAMALGYRKQSAYCLIIPQAIRHMLPKFKSSGLSHIKASAVVGYIAVHDLTKVGDIIRSVTFESFFTLIVTALIYLLIEFLFTLFMNFLIKKTDYKNRGTKHILRGLKLE